MCAREPVRAAFIGADQRTRFELGSVTKAITGMALADAIDRGELSMRSTVVEALPALAGSEVAGVTVKELCTHTSGLVRMPAGPGSLARALFLAIGFNPYRGITAADVVDHAGHQRLVGRGNFRYSNLGAALLGEVVAQRAATSFDSLIRERIFTPLGMLTAEVATDAQRAEPGWSSIGLPRASWVTGGFAPAGGVIATGDDIAQLMRGLLERTAPGSSSLDAIDAIDDVDTGLVTRRRGMFWIIDKTEGRAGTMVWHNGATGGYSAFLALFPDTGRGIAVLANTSRPAEQQRLALAIARNLRGDQ